MIEILLEMNNFPLFAHLFLYEILDTSMIDEKKVSPNEKPFFCNEMR